MKKKTTLEMFRDIEEIEVAADNEGEPLKSVKETLLYFCEKVEEALLKAEEFNKILEKYCVDDLDELDTILSNYRKHWRS